MKRRCAPTPQAVPLMPCISSAGRPLWPCRSDAEATSRHRRPRIASEAPPNPGTFQASHFWCCLTLPPGHDVRDVRAGGGRGALEDSDALCWVLWNQIVWCLQREMIVYWTTQTHSSSQGCSRVQRSCLKYLEEWFNKSSIIYSIPGGLPCSLIFTIFLGS